MRLIEDSLVLFILAGLLAEALAHVKERMRGFHVEPAASRTFSRTTRRWPGL